MAFRWVFGLRKYDSTRLVLKSCNTMSAKFLLERNVLLFYNNVAVSRLASLHNLFLWCKVKDSYKQLLCKYDLVDVSCRFLIYSSISRSFNEYCNLQLDVDV